ncbi:MAG: calcium-translocating P-type ATPase, PMCA-type [Methanobrevibacter sp.]|uniref:calcium-translocating P-type ATPase, PMCA-type n=1 Tax=Methanobrevibacter sp. TaxID=66852 RepID=UPI0026DF8224|nr:calcium-translocating P-type ATPase, PMCA-type [Methanobrevibacter sp.]MDO5848256.1 calcium-translocating P-type ATPase, PMCA-type [Methanobrevibacter sp.]
MDKILEIYDTSKMGLSNTEVINRQKRYGLNELKEEKKQHPIVLFLSQFLDILIILLLIAAVVAYFVGDIIDSYVILLVVCLNAVIGFTQEYRAEKAMEKLKTLVSTEAIVKRDGDVQIVPGNQLTVGDIVLIEEGDKVPADLILIKANDLRIDESSLTGESLPVTKTADYDSDVPIDIRKNEKKLAPHITYMDSTVIKGNGVGVVFAVGMETSIGKIAEMIQGEETETPLQKKIDKLGKVLAAIAIVVCAFVFVVGFLRGIPLAENFMTAVSLAVAAIPEGLPAVLTLTLALGMQHMAKSHAIVRKLLAVETLGSCTIVCSDKTGTLTENKMTVRAEKVLDGEMLNLISCLCVNSSKQDGKIIGDPTDGAIMEYGEKHNYLRSDFERKNPRVKEIPLDSERKRMTTIHEDGEKYIVLSKGAPEIILDSCKYINDNGTIKIIDAEIKENILNEIADMTSSALRVIGFGYKEYDYNPDDTNDEIETGLTFVGLLGLMDPPREEAKEAVKQCIEAGIQVKMITGDHQDTAAAIAREIGILTDGIVINGEELDNLTQEEYLKIVDDIQVYARVYPEQKMRIVETLENKGNVVSMTGDGVNDAPALKKASIGVAMGSGTDVAKESADMVIQDDNFATIIKAIKEGRKIYDNIKRFIKFQVSTNIGAILTILGASFMSLPLPFNPVQLLWINIIMDGPPAQTLGMEGAEKDIMQRDPKTGDILNKNVLVKIAVAGIVMALGTLGLYAYQLNIGASQTKAMTVAFTMFVIYQLFNAYNSKANSDKKSIYLYLAILISFVLQVLVIYIPYLQMIFRTTSIDLIDWIMMFIVACTILISNKIMNKAIPLD